MPTPPPGTVHNNAGNGGTVMMPWCQYDISLFPNSPPPSTPLPPPYIFLTLFLFFFLQLSLHILFPSPYIAFFSNLLLLLTFLFFSSCFLTLSNSLHILLFPIHSFLPYPSFLVSIYPSTPSFLLLSHLQGILASLTFALTALSNTWPIPANEGDWHLLLIVVMINNLLASIVDGSRAASQPALAPGSSGLLREALRLQREGVGVPATSATHTDQEQLPLANSKLGTRNPKLENEFHTQVRKRKE